MPFAGTVQDQLEIRALNERYCDAVFRRDARDWSDLWSENAHWSLMGTEVAGRDAIVTMWSSAMAGFTFVAFFAQMGALNIDGDQAHGTVYTHEVLELPDGTITRPVGRYEDRYVRHEGRWVFETRNYTMLKG